MQVRKKTDLMKSYLIGQRMTNVGTAAATDALDAAKIDYYLQHFGDLGGFVCIYVGVEDAIAGGKAIGGFTEGDWEKNKKK